MANNNPLSNFLHQKNKTGRLHFGTGPRDRGKLVSFTRKNYDIQVLPAPITSEL